MTNEHGSPVRIARRQKRHQCGLVALPAELRAVIYKYLLAHGATDPITLIRGSRFRTIGLSGASLLRTCRVIFNELKSTVAIFGNAASLEIRVVDTMAMPRAPCYVRDLDLTSVRKANVKIMLSQLSEKEIITLGLSFLVQKLSQAPSMQELAITVSATKSYTEKAHFDKLVTWLGTLRTEGQLELCWDSPGGHRPVAKKWGTLGVNTAGFVEMRSQHLE